MNSWHSFSPNGRWLVFSSKARSPYTQMYLTHLDEDGNDSPAILVDNTTAANRAVNIPEFVNIAPDGLLRIGGPAIDFYRLYDRAMYLQKQRRFDEAVAAWRQVLETDPEDALANSNLAAALLAAGRREEAVVQLRKASELKLRKAAADNPGDPAPHNALGLLLLDLGRRKTPLPSSGRRSAWSRSPIPVRIMPTWAKRWNSRGSGTRPLRSSTGRSRSTLAVLLRTTTSGSQWPGRARRRRR